MQKQEEQQTNTDIEQENPQQRPEILPENFWDAENNIVRWEALAQAYHELEQKQAQMVQLPDEQSSDEQRQQFYRRLGVPEKASDYRVVIDGEEFESDSEVNQRLHAAGLTPQQVQLVYTLAQEKILPLIEQADDRIPW